MSTIESLNISKMSNPLISKLETYLSLSISDKKLIEDLSTYIKFKSGYVFLQSNAVSDQAGLIISGVFRYFNEAVNGKEETTTLFVKENDFVIKIESFHDRKPSSQTIQAVTDGEMLVLTRDNFITVNEQIPGFGGTCVSLANDFLVEFTKFHRSLIDLTAKEKYLALMDRCPTILNRVKLVYIANYLGVTQSTLSRIRREIFETN